MSDDPANARNGKISSRWWIAALVVAMIATTGGGLYVFARNGQPAATADAKMAARAQEVMPFDLSRTTHRFTKTHDGGVQEVVVNDPSDTPDVRLIRSHLTTEAQNFRRGNYLDPARIHGMRMPGVSELAQGASRVNVAYSEIPGGAQISYSSTEPSLIAALHAWFDRQASDHSHPGMGG